MHLRFYLDPETGPPHIHRHNVEEREVEEVLQRPGEDRPGRKGARVAIGQTHAGRHLPLSMYQIQSPIVLLLSPQWN